MFDANLLDIVIRQCGDSVADDYEFLHNLQHGPGDTVKDRALKLKAMQLKRHLLREIAEVNGLYAQTSEERRTETADGTTIQRLTQNRFINKMKSIDSAPSPGVVEAMQGIYSLPAPEEHNEVRTESEAVAHPNPNPAGDQRGPELNPPNDGG